MAGALVLLLAQAGVAAGLVARRSHAPVCNPFPEKLETYCPSDHWVDKMVETDPDGAGKVFMDVGCNTGTDAVDWLERWGLRRNVTVAWRHTVEAKIGEEFCAERHRWWQGVPVFARRVVPEAPSKDPRVLCVEPMRGNVEIIRESAAAALGRADDPAFTVVEAAAGEHPGTALFPDDAPGEQRASLAVGGANRTRKVNVTTVDQLLSTHQLSSLDVLTVDTEGFDPAVLLGAEHALEIVRYLLFEVHQDFKNSPWETTSLLSVIQRLDSKGLDCFWALNSGDLLRLTGCWTEADEARFRPIPWNNVACVRRGDVWHPVLESFVK